VQDMAGICQQILLVFHGLKDLKKASGHLTEVGFVSVPEQRNREGNASRVRQIR